MPYFVPQAEAISQSSTSSPVLRGPRRAIALSTTLAKAAVLVALLLVPLRCARAQGYLFGRASYSIGSTSAGPASIAVGDFNGDGLADLAVVQPGRNSVAVLLGKPNGTLAPAVFTSTGNQPVFVVAADFNGDGHLDLAVANQNCASVLFCEGDGSISILLGNGDGTFQPSRTIANHTQPTGIAVGDFNGDGNPDLAVANGPENSVLVMLGNGDGTFEVPEEYSTPGNATSVAVADFNRDGLPDVAVGLSTGAVSIFLGKGRGAFEPSAELPALDAVNALAVGDFNRDGAPDLAVTYAQQKAASIFLGNGDGTFQPRADYLTEMYPTALAVADFNNDGFPDVAVANGNDQTFSILLGGRDGTLQPAQTFDLPGQPTAMAISDFNRDGNTDLAVVMSNLGAVSIIIGSGDGTFPSPEAFGESQGSWAIAAGDFNGDGKLDLVTTNLDSNSITVFLGQGGGALQVGDTFPVGAVPVSVAVGDFNRDGNLDVAVVNQTCTSVPCANGSIAVLLGNGDGTFQPATFYLVGNIPAAVAVADLNGDGVPDLLVANNGFDAGNTLSLLFGNGDGTFRSGGTLGTGIGPTQAVAAHFAGSGAVDLAVATATGISVFPGLGSGKFGSRNDYSLPEGARAIAAGDFNGDGKLDLAVTTSDTLMIFLGNGNGTFQAGAAYAVDVVTELSSIVVGDVNGDGKPDLLVGKSNNAVSVLLGNGDGTFQTNVDIPLGELEHGWAAGDFGGGGGLDVAAASSGLNAVFVSLNSPVAVLAPTALTFGAFDDGKVSPPASVTLSNPGGAPLAISGLTVTGPFAVENACPAALSPGGHCELAVTFVPTGEGARTGALRIADSAAPGAQSVSLRGTAVPMPMAELSSASLDFGYQNVNSTSAPKILTLTNAGGAPLQITGITASGDFTASSDCPATLGAGANCTISVSFSPSTDGSASGSITVADNAVSSPQAVTLAGTGADFTLATSPGTPAAINVEPGQSALFHLTVSPGGVESAVSFTCAGAPALTVCQVSPGSATLDGVTPLAVTVSVQTTATSGALWRRPWNPHGGSGFHVSLLCLALLLSIVCCLASLRWRAKWGLTGLVMAAVFAAGCGGGGGVAPVPTALQPGTAAGTYTLTVTAATTATSHTTTLSLTVQKGGGE